MDQSASSPARAVAKPRPSPPGLLTWCVSEEPDPASILAVTFTAEAARRLRHEVGRKPDGPATELSIHTLHAFGREVIDTWPGKFGLEHSPTVVHHEARDLLTRAATQLGWDLSSISPNELAAAVDRCRLDVDVRSETDDSLAALAAAYDEQLEDAGDRLGLVSAPAYIAMIERYLRMGRPSSCDASGSVRSLHFRLGRTRQRQGSSDARSGASSQVIDRR